MSEAIVVNGEWWLPDRPERRIAGTLTIDPEAGASLSLIGSMRDWRERGTPIADGRGMTFGVDDLNRSGTYPRILGVAGSTYYTLEDAFQTRLNNALGGLSVETIYVNQVFKGASFGNDEPIEATGMSFGLRHLAYWVSVSGLAETHAFPGDDGAWPEGPWATLALHRIDDQVGASPEGFRVTLGQSLGVSGDSILQRALTQNFRFRLDAEALHPPGTFIDVASDLQDLVSIALNRTASFEDVAFYHPDLQHQLREDHSIPIPIEYFVRWSDRDSRTEKLAVHRHEMLFALPDLGGIPGIEKWLNVAVQHRTALGRVMASRYRPSMYVPDRLLNRAAALESFDRTSTGFAGSKFKTRMKRCCQLAGSPFGTLVVDVDKWVELLRTERDDAAHHLDRRNLDGTGQFYVAESAYWLFVLCMLRAANAPTPVFDRIETNEHFTWLGRHLASVLL